MQQVRFTRSTAGQTSTMRTLADELVLLAITEKGTVASSASLRLDNGVAGAHLMDLALQQRIRLEDGDVLAVTDPTPTGDGPTDEVLEAIASADTPRTAKDWIGKLAGSGPHKEVVADLQERERLRTALVGARTPDARTVALACLVAATELVEEVFPDEEERARAQERLEELSRGDELRGALGAANEAMMAAMLAAVLAGVTASVTAATSAAIIGN